MNNQIRTEYMDVNPIMAKTFLESNTINRKLRVETVKQLADVIKRGEWVTTHQGISVSRNGNLLDGQHRLQAIVESGATVKMAVTFNQNEDSFKVIDCGLSRSLHERTNLNPRFVEIASFIERRLFGARGKITAESCLRIYNEHKYVIDLLHEYCPTMTKNVTVAAMRTAACLMIYKNKNYTLNTYRNLVLGNIDELSDIAKYFLKQVYVGHLALGKSGNISDVEKAFSIGMKLFDEDYADSKRLTITSSSFSEAKEKALNLIEIYTEA